MKKITLVSVLIAACMFLFSGCGGDIAETKDIAKIKEATKTQFPKNTMGVFVVVDYSGSMADKVSNATGGTDRKDEIVKRSIVSIGKKFDSYLDVSGCNIYCGLIVLNKSTVYIRALNLLSNNAEVVFHSWADNILNIDPDGGTPLGFAIDAAYRQMEGMDFKSKHVIVLTDGESNQGDSPENVLNKLKAANKMTMPAEFHFVAFDVNSACFSGVKSLGCTVVGASDEKTLNEKIDYILKEKILLEKED